MKKSRRFVGLDVHKETITVAIADGEAEPVFHSTIKHDEGSIRRLFKNLAKADSKELVKVAYEAGPCGFGLYRLLTSMGIACDVIAPSLVPQKAGDRVKTDRRDALKIARALRNGDLTPVRIPTELEEAFRDVVRARETAVVEVRRARHRLQKFLLRHDVRPPEKCKAWSAAYNRWLSLLRFDDLALQAVLEDGRSEVIHQVERVTRFEKEIERNIARLDKVTQDTIVALQALRGVKQLSAATIAIEMGSAARFPSARQLMSYAGEVSSEYSSGGRQSRGSITKAGNGHLRRVIGEAAWAYSRVIRPGTLLRRRRSLASPEIVAIAKKAEKRLNERFYALVFKGKHRNLAATAVARELLGFVWAIGMHVHQQHHPVAKNVA
jgi:transposase